MEASRPDGQGPFGSGSVADGYRDYLEPVLFRPWAMRLLDFVGLEPGQVVLDIASGTGVVARAAAARVGAGGEVIASDISASMLAQVARDLEPGSAPIRTREFAATELGVPDASVDVTLCQQGLPFIPDRVAAAREMRRVLRPGGRAGIAVWVITPRLEPFVVYGDALRAHGIPEPFPNAYDCTSNGMSASGVEDALVAAGFDDVVVETEQFELVWPSADFAVNAATGTPYGPVIAGLDGEAREAVLADIRGHMTASDGTAVTHQTTAVLGRGTAT